MRQTYLKRPSLHKFVHNRYELIVRLQNWLLPVVFLLWQSLDRLYASIENLLAVRTSSAFTYRVVAAIHLPETFGKHVVIAKLESVKMLDAIGRT